MGNWYVDWHPDFFVKQNIDLSFRLNTRLPQKTQIQGQGGGLYPIIHTKMQKCRI